MIKKMGLMGPWRGHCACDQLSWQPPEVILVDPGLQRNEPWLSPGCMPLAKVQLGALVDACHSHRLSTEVSWLPAILPLTLALK